MALPYSVYHVSELDDARTTYAPDSNQYAPLDPTSRAYYDDSAQHDDDYNSDEEPQRSPEADYDSYMPYDDPANYIWTGSNKSKAALIFPRPEPLGPSQPVTSPPVPLSGPSTQPSAHVSTTSPITCHHDDLRPVEIERLLRTPVQHPYLCYTGAQFQIPENPQCNTQLSLTNAPETEEAVCCCELCDVRYHGLYSKGNLARHGEREGLLACPEEGCGKKFRRTDALLKHKRREHGHASLPVLRRQA